MNAAGIGGLTEQALLLHLVDLVLAVSLLELLWLLMRRPPLLAQLLPNLLAGLSLTLALRLGLGGAGLAWVAPCLAAAGLAHGLDLRARRQGAEKTGGLPNPTIHPTAHPTAHPTFNPTAHPAVHPTVHPRAQPPMQPAVRPQPPAAATAPWSRRPETAPARLPTAPHQSPR